MLAPALLAALLLSAPGAGPSFACARAAAPEEKRICAVPELARLDRRLAVVYSWSVVDAARAPALRAAQRAWLDRRRACRAGAEAAQVVCLRAAYGDRIRELEAAAGPVPDAILAERKRHRWGRGSCSDLSQSFPELSDSPLPGAARFNERFEPEQDASLPCPSREAVDLGDGDSDRDEESFRIVWRTERYVTVDRRSSEMEAGAVHPMFGAVATTFDLVAARVISASDVFAVDAASEENLAAAVRARLRGVQLFPGADKAIAKAVFAEDHWVFDGAGAAIRFQPYEVAPYSDGLPEARFTWDELRPYLKAGSPLPPRT